MVDTVGLTDAVSGAPAYSGRALRQLNAVAFAGATSARPLGARSGVRPGTPSTTVTATSTTWTCQPFAGVLDGQTAAEAGPYPFAFDAVATGAMTAANASNPRIDIIYVDVDDPSEDASSVPAATRKYLAGTAAAIPAAPATPAGGMVIAQINVPKSGSGSPTVTWVAPYLAAAGGLVYFRSAAERDAETTLPVGTLGEVAGALYQWSGAVWARLIPEDTGWITPTLAAGWTAASGETPAYRVMYNVLYFRGRAASTGANQYAFTLPSQYWPSFQIIGLAENGGSPMRVVVSPTGGVGQVAAAVAASLSFSDFPTVIPG